MKKISLKLLTLVIALVFIFQFNIVMAASQTTLNNQKASNNEEITNAQSELEGVQQEKNEAVTEVENLDSQITSYETEIEELDSKISDLTNQITESEENIKQAEEEYQKESELLNERLVIMYENGNTSYLDVLLSSESLTDFISNYYLISELASYDTDLLEQIQNKKQEIETEKQKLESSKTELDTSKAQKQQTQTELAAAKSEKSKQVAQLSEEEQDIQARIDELKEANKEIDKEIAAAQAAIEAAKKQHQQNSGSSSSGGSSSGSNSGSSSGGGAVSSSGFIRPSNFPITTTWYYSSGALHGAVDFSGDGISGTPIYAVADGYVAISKAVTDGNGNYTSYGNYVLIAHYNGLYTLYAHMSSRAVSAGQTVSQGQVIGYVGSTGNSTGPHLHFEVRTSPGTYSCRVNPLNYLP